MRVHNISWLQSLRKVIYGNWNGIGGSSDVVDVGGLGDERGSGDEIDRGGLLDVTHVGGLLDDSNLCWLPNQNETQENQGIIFIGEVNRSIQSIVFT